MSRRSGGGSRLKQLLSNVSPPSGILKIIRKKLVKIGRKYHNFRYLSTPSIYMSSGKLEYSDHVEFAPSLYSVCITPADA
jgi:hypothetical protein